MNTDTFALGYAHTGAVQQCFMASVCNLLMYERSQWRGLLDAQGPYIANNRNVIVEGFLTNSDAKWLLFVDTDIEFRPHQVYQLLDAIEDERTQQIIGGLYFTHMGKGQPKTNKLMPAWFIRMEDGSYAIPESLLIGSTVPLGVCGMGFTLLGRTVLEKMAVAYKDDPYVWFGHDIAPTPVDGRRVRMGEDVTFCARAYALGYAPLGVATVVNHRKAHMENWDTFVESQILEKMQCEADAGGNEDVA